MLFCVSEVTPYVGVWIETTNGVEVMELLSVTPYVGVWIETNTIAQKTADSLSHPTWVCGLKPCYWQIAIPGNKSHPTWVCGLKHYLFALPDQGQGHTLRGCVD